MRHARRHRQHPRDPEPARGPSPLPPDARASVADLATWVERHWMVEWDLERPYTQELLNHPTINVAVEPASPASTGSHGARPQDDRRRRPRRRRRSSAPARSSRSTGARAHADEPRRAAVSGRVRRDALAPRCAPARTRRSRSSRTSCARGCPRPTRSLDVLAAIVATMLDDPAWSASTSWPRATRCRRARCSGCSGATSGSARSGCCSATGCTRRPSGSPRAATATGRRRRSSSATSTRRTSSATSRR